MRRISTILVSLLFSIIVYSQAPQGINYQAIARDTSGNLLINKAVSIKITIIANGANGTTVYSETFANTTNQYGLFNLVIGQGSALSGSFSSIVWDNGVYFLQVAIDPTGGSNFVTVSTSQLLSVPYAQYAAKAATVDSVEPGLNYIIAVFGIFPSQNSGGDYDNAILGEVRLFAGNFAPDGFMLCQGQLLAISQYEALYSILGTTYGGDGDSTFALPDLRGKFPLQH